MAILLPFSELIVDEGRIRKVVAESDVLDLADSIANLGLMQALVVEDDGRTLVAGYRRHLAIKHLNGDERTFDYQGAEVPSAHYPVVPLSALSPIQVREAELHENIKRVQLTWQEKAAAVQQLHELRKEQAEAENRPYYYKDTAKELDGDDFRDGRAHDVKQDLLAAAFLDDDEVKKAPSRKEAVKIIRKKLEIQHRRALAKEFDIKKLKTKHTLLQGDLFDIFPTIESLTIDCIVTDPPYGISADTFRNMKGRKHSYPDSESYSNAIVETIAVESFRVAKAKAHLYMLCDINRFLHIRKLFRDAGWEVFATPLIWYKGANSSVVPWPTYGPRRTYEAILYAVKGRRNVISVLPDVIDIYFERGMERAASKPPALYEHLINRTCYAGDTVLDPCCGTGPIFPAADATRTIAMGIEIDPEAIGIAAERLREKEEDAD